MSEEKINVTDILVPGALLLADEGMVRRQSDFVKAAYNPYVNEDGIAYIDICGSLSPRPSFFGGASYLELQATLEAASEMKPKAIVLAINSPGGEVDGLFSACASIRNIRENVPVYAYATSMACSAAYAIGASCTAFYASPYAELGSCGVYCECQNATGYAEKQGLFSKVFRSKHAGKKNLSPFTEEGEKALQERIDELEGHYFDAIAEGRGMDKDACIAGFGGGGVMNAVSALSAGMIDGVYSEDEFLDEIYKCIGAKEMDVTKMSAEDQQKQFADLLAVNPSLLDSFKAEEDKRINAITSLSASWCQDAVNEAVKNRLTLEEATSNVLACAKAEIARLEAENKDLAEKLSAVQPIMDAADGMEAVVTPQTEGLNEEEKAIADAVAYFNKSR